MNGHSETTRRRGRPRVGDKRRQILDAALELFADKGYHGTAVPEVAERADVGTGTLYRYFANKEALVNEVFRDAKARLQAALFAPPAAAPEGPRAWFLDTWARLAGFAQAEPVAFRFLEMQDHTPYLDADSLALERATLAPLLAVAQELRRAGIVRADLPAEAAIAFAWGAFVAVFKADRLGYFAAEAPVVRAIGEACWDGLKCPTP